MITEQKTKICPVCQGHGGTPPYYGFPTRCWKCHGRRVVEDND